MVFSHHEFAKRGKAMEFGFDLNLSIWCRKWYFIIFLWTIQITFIEKLKSLLLNVVNTLNANSIPWLTCEDEKNIKSEKHQMPKLTKFHSPILIPNHSTVSIVFHSYCFHDDPGTSMLLTTIWVSGWNIYEIQKRVYVMKKQFNSV